MAYEYAKVVLYAYPHLAALSEAVSAGVENKAVLSFRGVRDTLQEAERIADEIAVREALDALAADMERVLAQCTDEESFYLEYKYFRRRCVLEGRFAGRTVSCSERHYFRRQCVLLRKIAFLLGTRGWTEKEYVRTFGGFAPFARVLRALETGKEARVTARRGRRDIAFVPGRYVQKSDCSCGVRGRFPRKTSAATATPAAHTRQMTTICTGPGEALSGAGTASSPDTCER